MYKYSLMALTVASAVAVAPAAASPRDVAELAATPARLIVPVAKLEAEGLKTRAIEHVVMLDAAAAPSDRAQLDLDAAWSGATAAGAAPAPRWRDMDAAWSGAETATAAAIAHADEFYALIDAETAAPPTKPAMDADQADADAGATETPSAPAALSEDAAATRPEIGAATTAILEATPALRPQSLMDRLVSAARERELGFSSLDTAEIETGGVPPVATPERDADAATREIYETLAP